MDKTDASARNESVLLDPEIFIHSQCRSNEFNASACTVLMCGPA